MNSHFRGVLFDLDGTLLNTLEDLADSVNAVLAAHGFPVHAADSYRFFVGDGIQNLILRALPAAEADEDLARRLLPDVDAQYDLRWHSKTAPYSGISGTISALKERGMKLAILSNKPHRFTVEIVDHYFPDSPFDIVYGCRDGVPRKPDPSAAFEIASRLGIPSDQWVYVGDSNTDMKTALSAGFFAVGAAWGFRPVEELVAAGANRIIQKPEEILDILSRRPENHDTVTAE